MLWLFYTSCRYCPPRVQESACYTITTNVSTCESIFVQKHVPPDLSAPTLTKKFNWPTPFRWLNMYICLVSFKALEHLWHNWQLNENTCPIYLLTHQKYIIIQPLMVYSFNLLCVVYDCILRIRSAWTRFEDQFKAWKFLVIGKL